MLKNLKGENISETFKFLKRNLDMINVQNSKSSKFFKYTIQTEPYVFKDQLITTNDFTKVMKDIERLNIIDNVCSEESKNPVSNLSAF